jgi:hypothetical protein
MIYQELCLMFLLGVVILSPMELQDLRQRAQLSLDIARRIVERARSEVQIANERLKKAEGDLARVQAEADRRLAAISVVEEMEAELGRKETYLPYANMKQDDAMRHALLKAQQTMNAAELADALKAGGYEFASENPANSLIVAASTNRKGYFSKTKEGHRTLIGLAEWDGEPSNPFDFLNDEPGDGAGEIKRVL